MRHLSLKSRALGSAPCPTRVIEARSCGHHQCVHQSEPVRESAPTRDVLVHHSSRVDLAKYIGYDRAVKRVKIGEFRDRASELIRRAAEGETIVILHRDREVAKVVPIRPDDADGAAGLIGSLAGTAEIRGDIEEPIAQPGDWFLRFK